MRNIQLALAAIAAGLLLTFMTLPSAQAASAGPTAKSPLGANQGDGLVTRVGRGGRGGRGGGGRGGARGGGGGGGKSFSRGGGRGGSASRGRASSSRSYSRSGRSYSRSGRSYSRSGRSYSRSGRSYSRSGRSYGTSRYRGTPHKKSYYAHKKGYYGRYSKGHRYAYRYRPYLRGGAAIAYGYYGCEWLRRNAISTGSAYWWQRYNDCRYGYY